MTKVLHNIGYNLAGRFAILALSLLSACYIYKSYGDDTLGIVYFALTLSTVLTSVLEIGVSSTTIREIAAHYQSDKKYVGDLIRTASLFYWLGYLLLIGAVYWSAPLIVRHWIKLGRMDAGAAIMVLRVIGSGALLALPRTLYASIFRGLQRMDLNNLIDVTGLCVQQTVAILIIALGGSLRELVWWFAASFVLPTCLYQYLIGSFLPWSSLLPGWQWYVVERNWHFTSRMVVVSSLSMVQVQADKLAVSKFLALSDFGYYSILAAMATRTSVLVEAVSQAAFPALAELLQQRRRREAIACYTRLDRMICFGTLPIFAGLAFASKPVFALIFSQKVAEMLFIPAVLLCIGHYMNAAFSMLYVYSLADGHPELAARYLVVALVVCTPVTVALVGYLGLVGAGASWVFLHVVTYTYLVPTICRTCKVISISSWFSNQGKLALLGLATYGLALLGVSRIGNGRLGELGLAYALASAGFLWSTALMVPDEVADARKLVQRVFDRWRIPEDA